MVGFKFGKQRKTNKPYKYTVYCINFIPKFKCLNGPLTLTKNYYIIDYTTNLERKMLQYSSTNRFSNCSIDLCFTFKSRHYAMLAKAFITSLIGDLKLNIYYYKQQEVFTANLNEFVNIHKMMKTYNDTLKKNQ